jgi:mRNA interferase MazF
MEKDFDTWNTKKKEIETKNDDEPKVYFQKREIWWCALGKNVGYEQDGKGESFERPVLIFRKFNKHIFLGIPLTTRPKNLKLPFYLKMTGAETESTAILSQIRLLSSKRLIRHVETVSPKLFHSIKDRLRSIQDI